MDDFLGKIVDAGTTVFNRLADIELAKFELTASANAAAADRRNRADNAPRTTGGGFGISPNTMLLVGLGAVALFAAPRVLKALK